MGGLELTERWKVERYGGDEQLKRQHEQRQHNSEAVLKTLLDLVKGGLSAEEARQKLNAAGPKGKAWGEMAENITAKAKEDPEIRLLLESVLQFGQLRIAGLGRHVPALERALDCVTTLGVAALDHRDAFATEQLVALTTYAVSIVEALSEQRPGLVRPFARKALQWPVMADVEPDWARRANEKLQQVLQLGDDTLHGHLDKSKAYDLQNTSRRYARGIVETLEKNLQCESLVAERQEIIRWKMAKDGIKVWVPQPPGWFHEAAKLPPFGRDTTGAWLSVGMKMLREQRPYLPEHPDWKGLKTHWEHRGDAPTRGRMWNSIKDALRSPLKTIARGQRAIE